MDSRAPPHRVNLEENLMKLKNNKIRVTIGDRTTLTDKNVVTGTSGENVTEKYIT